MAIDSSFGLTVAAEDVFGNVVTSFNGSVTLVLANNPGGGALGGTTTVTAVQGIATFAGLTISMTSTDYTLQATSTGLTSTTTGPLNVTPPATQLVVTTEPPTSVIAGGDFGLTVSVDDAHRQPGAQLQRQCDHRLGERPQRQLPRRRLTVTAVDGVATFTGLSLDKAGDYTFDSHQRPTDRRDDRSS